MWQNSPKNRMALLNGNKSEKQFLVCSVKLGDLTDKIVNKQDKNYVQNGENGNLISIQTLFHMIMVSSRCAHRCLQENSQAARIFERPGLSCAKHC